MKLLIGFEFISESLLRINTRRGSKHVVAHRLMISYPSKLLVLLATDELILHIDRRQLRAERLRRLDRSQSEDTSPCLHYQRDLHCQGSTSQQLLPLNNFYHFTNFTIVKYSRDYISGTHDECYFYSSIILRSPNLFTKKKLYSAFEGGDEI